MTTSVQLKWKQEYSDIVEKRELCIMIKVQRDYDTENPPILRKNVNLHRHSSAPGKGAPVNPMDCQLSWAEPQNGPQVSEDEPCRIREICGTVRTEAASGPLCP